MIFLLVKSKLETLEENGLGFLRVFTFPTFQVAVATLMAFLICLILGPLVIRWLRKQKIGDLPNFDQAEINKMMEGKKGTPTMGGILIIAAIAISTLLIADLRNFYVQMAVLCLLLYGGVGMTDDWLKLTAGRRSGSRQGLTSLEKILFQIGFAVILSYFTYHHFQRLEQATAFHVPFFKAVQIHLPLAAFVVIGTVVMTGSSNAVNLTDGLDGLAAGTMAIVSFAFVLLALIAGTVAYATFLFLPYIQASDQMAVIAGAMVGACLGFLWYNCNPAQVFMGDTGSLAMGALLGYISVVIRQELMLFMVGGIFVLEALSVILQVSYFKYTKRKYGEGRRIFLMSPLHHHFQRKGWGENQVVVRFWLITAMLAAMALATIKLR